MNYGKIFHKKKLKTISKNTFKCHQNTLNKKYDYEYPPSYLTYGRPDRTGRSRNVQALPGI